jgi:transcriptional regulator with XRE-family HTH domain
MKSMVDKIAVLVGKNIRKHRERQSFSQEAFADYVKMDRSNFGAIERGERNISIYTLARIAIGLKVEMRDLVPEVHEILAQILR